MLKLCNSNENKTIVANGKIFITAINAKNTNVGVLRIDFRMQMNSDIKLLNVPKVESTHVKT